MSLDLGAHRFWRATRDDLFTLLEEHFASDTEALVGPVEGWPGAEARARFIACEAGDLEELAALLEHPVDRVVVKLLIFATRTVPDGLFEDVVRAGITTRNPSFNTHYIWPATLMYGADTVREVIARVEREEGRDTASARYWLSVPIEDMVFPDPRGYAERRAELMRKHGLEPPRD